MPNCIIPEVDESWAIQNVIVDSHRMQRPLSGPSSPVHKPKQSHPKHRQHWRITPMVPLALPNLHPTNSTVHESDPTARKQYASQRLAITKVRRRIYRQTHENIPCAVDDHKAVHKRSA